MRLSPTLALAGLVVAAVPAAAQMSAPPKVHNRTLSIVTENGRQIFRLDEKRNDGVAWWPDMAFSTGTIEVDIRGRDLLSGSFVGIAFHGVDPATYEAIYFRPFNFKNPDLARRQRAVQYISHPQHPWQTLRERHPNVYEKPVDPPPDPNGWFRATIKVERDAVTVSVDGRADPVLEVKRLTDRQTGWVGLWVGNESPGDFSNVRITPAAVTKQ